MMVLLFVLASRLCRFFRAQGKVEEMPKILNNEAIMFALYGRQNSRARAAYGSAKQLWKTS
jgi:hypothetical protein